MWARRWGSAWTRVDELAGQARLVAQRLAGDRRNCGKRASIRTIATILQLVALTTELLGFPRHLSQHVGGMVITQRPLCEMVPIENAAMADRTVIEWDKDDIDALGIFKVDMLALGMLTCIPRALVDDQFVYARACHCRCTRFRRKIRAFTR